MNNNGHCHRIRLINNDIKHEANEKLIMVLLLKN